MQERDLLLESFAAAAESRRPTEVDEHVDEWAGSPASPLVVIGPAASGRAEALCRFAARRRAVGEDVVLHHAGLAAPAAETPRVLWQLLLQLRAAAGIVQMPPPDETSMRETLPNWLARAAAQGPLWLVIADIDALAALDGGIAWLPAYHPPNLHCVASATPGACMQSLSGAGWRPLYRDAAAAAPAANRRADADNDTIATVAAVLALAREPLGEDTLAAVCDLTAPAVATALDALQSQLLFTDDDCWAPAHPAIRQAWLNAWLPDQGPRQRLCEALAAHAGPLLAPAYLRVGRRPDRVLETLMQPEAVLATDDPTGRMQWLAEWSALGAGEAVPLLAQLLAEAPAAPERAASLYLAAHGLAAAVGETAPAEWLDRAIDRSEAAGSSALGARARRRRAQDAIDRGDWTAAEHDARAALRWLEPHDENTMSSAARHELARAAEGAGRLDQARALYQEALEVSEAAECADSPRLLPDLANLIGVLRATQSLDAARPLAQRAAHIARTACGPAHPATAAACDQLAALAYAGGDYAAAESAYREALDAAKAAFGPEHTATAAARHNLGTVLDARRAFAEAEDCYRKALTVREAIHGREHADTAATLHNLAAVLDVVGRADEAEALYRETVDIWERLYGAEHAATITSLTNLAGVLAARGAYADAEACYRAAVEGWRRLLGDQHPNTLTTLAELGGLYAEGGKPELAEPLLEHVVETSAAVLGVTDTHHVNSVCALAALWRDHGRSNDAQQLLTDTLSGVESGLGLLAPAVQQLRRQLDTLRGDVLH